MIVQKTRRDQTDFSKEIQNFKKAGVKHLAFFSFQQDLLSFLPQTKAHQFNPAYFGSDGWGAKQELLEQFKEKNYNADNFIGFKQEYWDQKVDNKLEKQFVSLSKKINGTYPGMYEAIAFETALIVFEAMKKSKTLKHEDLKRSLKKTNMKHLLTTSLRL